MTENARKVQALLFLSPEPVSAERLAEVCEISSEEAVAGLEELASELREREHGLVLREVAGGFTLASDPIAEQAARRLFSATRSQALTQAQAECLAVVAYLQPASRPEIARIRGVSSESAVAALLERGFIEEAGRSQFGAVNYRTTELFEKLFGLKSLDELPDPHEFDPSPQEEADLRQRLLRASEHGSAE